jgi:hypothetical protein
VLVAECYECHDAKKQKGDLRLDHRDGLLKGGEEGPAIVLSDAKSILIQSIAIRNCFLVFVQLRIANRMATLPQAPTVKNPLQSARLTHQINTAEKTTTHPNNFLNLLDDAATQNTTESNDSTIRQQGTSTTTTKSTYSEVQGDA